MDFNELFKTADWKQEKHVPVIEVMGTAKKGEPIMVHAMVGKEIAHPNTTEHHIRWIDLYFLPDGEKFPYQIGKSEFNAHGASVQGPNSSTVYADPKTSFTFKTEKPGKIIAFSFCNIHGLWKNEMELKL
ncbi:MAG: class II SORL domain-containing protein [Candidatus Lokiarchaeota archaeon]|jgi:superoxide reductase